MAYLLFEIPALTRLYRRNFKIRQLRKFSNTCGVIVKNEESVASAMYLENKVYGSDPMNTDAIRVIFNSCYAILTKGSDCGTIQGSCRVYGD